MNCTPKALLGKFVSEMVLNNGITVLFTGINAGVIKENFKFFFQAHISYNLTGSIQIN